MEVGLEGSLRQAHRLPGHNRRHHDFCRDFWSRAEAAELSYVVWIDVDSRLANRRWCQALQTGLDRVV